MEKLLFDSSEKGYSGGYNRSYSDTVTTDRELIETQWIHDSHSTVASFMNS